MLKAVVMHLMVFHASLFIMICHSQESSLYTKYNACGKDGVCDCSDDIYMGFVVDCSHHGLNSVPQGIPTNTNYLILDNNNLPTLPSDCLEGLEALTLLSVSRNNITTLPNGVFKDLTALSSLSLGNNPLTTLPSTVFESLNSLKDLSLLETSLATLPPNVFEGLNSLEVLSLSSIIFTTFPASVSKGLTSLRSLWLTNNSLSTISNGDLKGLSSLESLHLDQNNLKTLPNGAFQGLVMLKTLNIDQSNLQTLPNGAFQGLVMLKTLSLSVNFLSTLPCNVFHGLSSLETLDLEYNNFTTLPNGVFTDLTTLRTLSLRGNFLITLSSDVFKGLTALQRLSLSRNKFIILPNGCQGLTTLRMLSLNDNLLSSLSNDVFINCLSSLQSLDLARNNIATLPNSVFKGLTSLNHLSLDGNVLSTISSNVFEDLTSLSTLALAWNSITTIRSTAFKGLTTLRYLLLTENRISNLPSNVFEGLNSLEALELSGNRISNLPSNVFEGLNSLEVLYLTGNRISNLPSNVFEDLSSLDALYVDLNNITILPRGIFKSVKKLTRIMLSCNQLSTLHSTTFEGLASIMSLNLSRNMLSALPDDIFSGLSALQILDLSGNKLSRIPTRVEDLNSLIVMYLNENMIEVFDIGIFRGLVSFSAIDLSDNRISQIIPGTLNTSVPRNKLETIQLQRNNLKIIPKHAFVGFEEIRLISLFNNHIHILADEAFSNTNVTYLLLFDNNLTSITGNPFGSSSIKQIHIYRNNIAQIDAQSLMKTSTNTSLYVSCYHLNTLPKNPNHEKVQCMSASSTASISIDREPILVDTLTRSGFQCSLREQFTPDENPMSNSVLHGNGHSNVRNMICTPCAQGSYNDNIALKCLPCPKGGFYQDEIAQTKCKLCNIGMYVNNGGGTSSKDCNVCPEGTNQTIHAGYRACYCKKDFARTDRYGPCYRCLQKGINCSEEFQALLPGYMWNWSIPGANLTKYKQFVAHIMLNMDTDLETMNYPGIIPRVFKCPYSGSCPNDNDNIAGNCAVGYRGWLCTNCMPGYYSVLNSCVPCPSLVILILETCIFFAICAVVCIVLVRRGNGNYDKEYHSRSLFDIIISRIKILIGFYQVIGEMLTSLHDISWTGTLLTIGKFIITFEINILKLFVRPRCFDVRFDLNPKSQLIISSIVPLMIALIPFLCYHMRKLYVRIRYSSTAYMSFESHFQNLKASLCTCVVVLWFIMYPPVCSVIFTLYPMSCTSFALDQNKTYRITRLRSDFDMDCSELKVYHIVAFILTPMYVIAFPVVLFYNLRKNYLESRNSARGGHGDLLFETTDDSNTTNFFKVSSTPRYHHFFCENYKGNFWFWEIVELTRKVTQILLLCIYGWEDRTTVVLTTVISALFLLLHARYQPMKSSYEQSLQMLSLTAIFLNVAVVSNSIPEESEGPISIFLLLLNIAILAIVGGELVVVVVMHVMKLRMIANIFMKTK